MIGGIDEIKVEKNNFKINIQILYEKFRNWIKHVQNPNKSHQDVTEKLNKFLNK